MRTIQRIESKHKYTYCLVTLPASVSLLLRWIALNDCSAMLKAGLHYGKNTTTKPLPTIYNAGTTKDANRSKVAMTLTVESATVQQCATRRMDEYREVKEDTSHRNSNSTPQDDNDKL